MIKVIPIIKIGYQTVIRNGWGDDLVKDQDIWYAITPSLKEFLQNKNCNDFKS